MPVIQVKNLKKYYQIHKKSPGVIGSLHSIFNRKYFDVKAVDGINFNLDEGELVGFIGPNGAGKTTTLKCLSGLLYPSSGDLSVLGFAPFDRKHDFLKKISIIMGQKNQLWWDLPAIETFILNKEIYEVPQRQFDKTLDELVELLDVKDQLNIQVRKLSLGQRMKMELIAGLVHSPKILFLDEPTIGLDVVMQKKLREFIRVYNKKYKATILLTSHYMDDVKELCDRVIIIDKGKQIFDGQLEKLMKDVANHKLITILLEENVDIEQLKKIGDIKEYLFPKVVLSVNRDLVIKQASDLIKKYKISDLNIEEPKIEDIIREVFTREDVA